MRHDTFAYWRQPYGTLAALENQHAKFIFQLLDPDRQGWLADVATFGGMAEVLFLGEGDDVAQFCEGHNVRP
ncbi:hypothetical protein D3C85_1636230 [compost metagenome]